MTDNNPNVTLVPTNIMQDNALFNCGFIHQEGNQRFTPDGYSATLNEPNEDRIIVTLGDRVQIRLGPNDKAHVWFSEGKASHRTSIDLMWALLICTEYNHLIVKNHLESDLAWAKQTTPAYLDMHQMGM